MSRYDPYTLTLGDIVLITCSDGDLTIAPERLFRDVPVARSAPLLQPVNAQGHAIVPMHALVIRAGQRLILVDTGLGPSSPLRAQPGTLLDGLAQAGISPTAISDVVLSHAHPDHLGWSTSVVAGQRRPTFPHARYWLAGPEFRHWTQPQFLATVPALRDHLPVLVASGQLELPEGEVEIAPGIRLLETPGHTPGHRSVLISSGKAVALFTGDLFHHPLHLQKPNWGSAFDSNPEQAYRTRLRVLQQAAAERLLLVAYHHPTPFGYAEHWGASYRWQPAD
jgi:glyoxylase-like metal-dependent hydrolase (beta-lactamase superfamily II)